MARDILAAEARARQAIEGLELAEAVLNRETKRKERTRAGRVDRLEEAVEAVWKASREDETLRRQAREAKGALHEANQMRWTLAMSGKRIALGEAKKLSGPYLSYQDLVQEGYIGLLRAAKRFDPKRELRFSTYARWWVRAQMVRSIDRKGRPIRLPGGAVAHLRKLEKARRRFEADGVEYTVADLAIEVGIDENRARYLLAHGSTISLDAPMDDGPNGRKLEDFLPDDDVEKPDEEVMQQEEIARLLEALQHVLTERHRFVLRQRFGLDDREYRTLAEIGRRMDLSRERVRQIERQALRKLRESGLIREAA